MSARSQGPVRGGAEARTARGVAVLVALAALVVVAAVANLCIGSLQVPLPELVATITGADRTSTAAQVIWSIRLPRLIEAGLLGGALALSGYLLQTFFNNPLAGPYVLGISSGAKLAVAILMVVVVGASGVVSSWMALAAALVGSLAVTGCVLAVSRRVRSVSELVVAGVMIGYLCNAATDILVTFASDASIVNLRNWSMGSFSGANWGQVGFVSVVVLLAFAATLMLSKPLGAYRLGERYAQSVGVNVGAFRLAVIALSSLLSACVTAFAGPISFVGIAVPHIAKRLLGSSRPLVALPATFLGGMLFCLCCDLIARSAFAPTEVAVSTVTAVFGAPVVISILLGRTGRGERS